MGRRFVQFNRRLSFALTPAHLGEANVFSMYRKCAQMLFSQPDVTLVVDVGAGQGWQFPEEIKRRFQLTLVGVELDPTEFAPNTIVDQKIICDVTEEIQIPPGSADLITCYSGIEHFADNRAFLENAFAALRPGGYLLAQFPGTWAPHALLNRLLPQRISARILAALIPGSDQECGFRAHYDRTRYSRSRAIAEQNDFEVDYHFPGYFGAAYFAFFTPFYLVHLLYDHLRFCFGLRDLASYNLFVLRKPGGVDSGVLWTDSTGIRAPGDRTSEEAELD